MRLLQLRDLLAAAIHEVADGRGRVDNLSVRLRQGVEVEDLRMAIRAARAAPVPPPEVTEEAARGPKFSVALPYALVRRT